MKESLVKQAARAHWSESTYKEDAELAYDDCDCLSVIALAKSIALRAFEKGAEWQAKQSCTECKNPDTYLKEQVQQSKEETKTKEAPGFNKYGQFYGFD